ncbi:MAG TPA: vanadium-dependent haloperoxidase [Pyrinomonadaceae bacterium]
MRVKTLIKSLVITLSVGIAVGLISVYPLLTVACAAAPRAPLAVPVTRSATALPAQATDALIEWNQQAVTLSLRPVPALSPVQQTRVMAIFQLAVHDAVNGITGEYETYLSPASPPQNASPVAAAIAAAHHAAKQLFPGNDMMLDERYANSLAAHGLSPDNPGIAFGSSAAAAILAARANDHSSEAQFAYDAPGAGAPGVWVRLNNAAALLPGWGNVTPFVLRTSSQFRPEAPPALDSEQYAKDYNEIKLIGVNSGSTRSATQSQIATFWRASPTAIWNPVLTQLVQTRNATLSENARLFALFYLAAADASIACWEAKYHYNFWRPQAAIINGEFDSNDETVGNGTWQPFVGTPPHPEYPSGHTSNSNAMARILTAEFGDTPGVPIVVTVSGITRQWSSLSEAVQEVIDARVYSGIHFRNSDEVGARMGRQVAKFVSKHALRRSK